MTWLDRWLAETDETTCTPCTQPLEPSTHAGLTGYKQLVPNLYPNLYPAPPPHTKKDRGQVDKSTCTQLLYPAKPAPVLRLQPLGTKGQRVQVPEEEQPRGESFGLTPRAHDATLESLCRGLPPEEAEALRQERSGILEYLGGMSRPMADAAAGLPVRGPPADLAMSI